MANDTDDEFSGFSSDDFSEFFDEPQESSSVSEVPGSQERPPLREETGEDNDDDGELNELAGTGAGTVVGDPCFSCCFPYQGNPDYWEPR